MNIKEPNLQTIITNLYGSTFKKHKSIKTTFSIFRGYKNQQDEVLYFCLIKVPATDHISEGTVHYALRKYNPFLSKVQFLEVERNFNFAYYLIKSYKSLISLDEHINLKKDCQQVMDKDHIIKTIQFLIQIYKSKKWSQFPQLTPKTLAFNEQNDLKICDYSFYFKKNMELRSLTENLCSCINPMIKIALTSKSTRFLPSDDDFYRLKQYYGQKFANLIKILVLNPMQDMEKQGVLNGKGKCINIKKVEQALQHYKKNVQQDMNTTLNETFEQDYPSPNLSAKKNSQSDLISRDSLRQPFLIKDDDKKQKRKKFIIIAAVTAILLLIIAGGIFFFTYHSNPIVCEVGTFKAKQTNQCLACTDGCLRCDSDQKTACLSCSGKMYLVLNEENDTSGSCQVTCVSGIILRSNLCLKSKK